ncbi:MAG: hypothetical protein AB4352_18815 [Hormoscilla sp.]
MTLSRDRRWIVVTGAIMDITRFKRATVHFTSQLSVDGYKLPSGEYRVGLSGASEAVGYSDRWLRQLLQRNNPEPKALKALRDLGFTAEQIEGQVAERGEGVRGASRVKTISLRDFSFLIIYAAAKGKSQAIALNQALVEMSLLDFFRSAFGDRPLTFSEKRELFYRSYAETIDWLAEDRLEIEALWLWGDPEELIDWNASRL